MNDLDGDGGCLDIDECTQPNICVENARCTNVVGSYYCDCIPGYVGVGKLGMDKDCLDLDECEGK